MATLCRSRAVRASCRPSSRRVLMCPASASTSASRSPETAACASSRLRSLRSRWVHCRRPPCPAAAAREKKWPPRPRDGRCHRRPITPGPPHPPLETLPCPRFLLTPRPRLSPHARRLTHSHTHLLHLYLSLRRRVCSGGVVRDAHHAWHEDLHQLAHGQEGARGRHGVFARQPSSRLPHLRPGKPPAAAAPRSPTVSARGSSSPRSRLAPAA